MSSILDACSIPEATFQPSLLIAEAAENGPLKGSDGRVSLLARTEPEDRGDRVAGNGLDESFGAIV